MKAMPRLLVRPSEPAVGSRLTAGVKEVHYSQRPLLQHR